MLNYQSATQLKKMARAVERAGSKKGRPLKLGESLDALAQARGFAGWSALAPKLSRKSVDSMLSPFELKHAQDNSESFSAEAVAQECILQVQTGFYLHTPAYPRPCEYVRVCDPLGREIAYWDEKEWAEDPAVVMGALIGCLARGSSAEPPKPELASATNVKLPFGICVETKQQGGGVSSDLLKELTTADDDRDGRSRAHGAAEAIEWFLLAMACEGIDLSDPRISTALQTAVQSVVDKTLS